MGVATPCSYSGECECKKYNFSWSNAIECKERQKVLEVCAALWGENQKVERANWLMSVMYIESQFNTKAGDIGGYVGLIQFGKSASIAIDKKRSELINLTAEEQLDYVLKYFELSYFTNKLTSMISLYMSVNYPNNVINNKINPNDIVYSAPSGAYWK